MNYFVVVALVCAACCCAVRGDTVSGTCNYAGTCKWDIDSDKKTLTISGNGTMDDYTYYSSYYYAPWMQNDNPSKFDKVIIEDGISNIGDYAFYLHHGLTSITVKGNLTSIGKYVIQECDQLESFTIEGSVGSITDSTFAACHGGLTIKGSLGNNYHNTFICGFTSIVIEGSASIPAGSFYVERSSLETVFIGSVEGHLINDVAFAGSENLTSVTLGDVESIGYGAFTQCGNLKEIHLGNSASLSIGRRAFANCGIEELVLPSSITYMDIEAFYGCTKLKNLTIQCSSISEEAFGYCESLKSIKFDAPNISIGNNAFANCGFEELFIPSSVESIGDSAFESCTSLTIASIDSGVVSLPSGIFRDCSSLKKMVIPASVEYIGYGAFSGCSSLGMVYYAGLHNPCPYSAFDGCLIDRVVVPPEFEDYYICGVEPKRASATLSGASTVNDHVVRVVVSLVMLISVLLF